MSHETGRQGNRESHCSVFPNVTLRDRALSYSVGRALRDLQGSQQESERERLEKGETENWRTHRVRARESIWSTRMKRRNGWLQPLNRQERASDLSTDRPPVLYVFYCGAACGLRLGFWLKLRLPGFDLQA